MDNVVKTFTIVDTETQRNKEIKSQATTIGELKRDLRQNGFNVEGKTIQEALTRTEFHDDSALLPHDVPYKGTTTNNLVFRLTKINKQVRSGMDRRQAYDEVKRLGLGDAIKAKFGKNFTQVSTNDLVNFINTNSGKKAAAKEAPKAAPAPKTAPKETPKEAPAEGGCKCEEHLRNLCSVLIENGTIKEEDMETIFGSTPVEAAAPADGKEATYSQEELSALINGL